MMVVSISKTTVTLVLLAISAIRSQSIKQECEALDGITDKSSLFHRGKCYVMTLHPSSMSWYKAALSCNDISNGNQPRGLAMWLSNTVFEWVKTTAFNAEWIWVGFHMVEDAPGGVTDDQVMYFGQGPNQYTDDSWSTGLTMNSKILVHSAADGWNAAQAVGSIFTNGADAGYADEGATASYPHVICEYSDFTVHHVMIEASRLTSDVLAEQSTALSKNGCIARCFSKAICNSVAFSSSTGDCQLYMVADDDLGGFFNSDWLVSDANYDLFMAKVM